MKQLLFLLITFFSFSASAVSSLTSFALKWHEEHVNALSREEQVTLGQLIKAYENAALYDALLRKEFLLLQKIMATIHNTPSDSHAPHFAQLAAHLREINEKILPAYQSWYTNWQICAEDIETSKSSILKAALHYLQEEGRNLVKHMLEDSRGTLQNEVVYSARIFETIAHDLQQYAPIYSTLFMESTDLPFTPIEQDFDMALRISNRIEQDIESLQQTTLFTKIIGITLEIKTAEFMRALFAPFSDDIKAEVNAHFELYTNNNEAADEINPLSQ